MHDKQTHNIFDVMGQVYNAPRPDLVHQCTKDLVTQWMYNNTLHYLPVQDQQFSIVEKHHNFTQYCRAIASLTSRLHSPFNSV